MVMGMRAEEYSYTFEKTQFSANGTKVLGNVGWTLDGNGGYWGYDGTKGQQFGSGNKPYKEMTLSTSGIPGTITKIVINTSGASDIKGTATIKVGETEFGKITLTKTATKYTFEGSAKGEVVISYTQTSSKAIYIKSIAITYVTESYVAAPGLPESCNFTESEKSIEIINNDSEATVYYTTDGDTPTKNSAVYSEPFSISETTTVKAIAIRGNYCSEIVSATYTKVSEEDYVNVSFSINGEVDVNNDVKILKEVELQESSLPEISFPNGISLKGWSKDKNSTDVETFPITNITDDITLYAVFVRPASFRLVTDVAELTAGDKVIIACPEFCKAISTDEMIINGNACAQSTLVTIEGSGNILSPTKMTRIFTLGKNDDDFTFKENDKYLACPEDNNRLAMQEADGSEDSWTIIIKEEGVAVINNKVYTKRSIQYNSSSPRFACYESVQKSIAIYKEATSEVLSTTYTPVTISSIGYATMYLADAVAMPAGVEAYIATGVNGDYLQMEQVMGTLPAETGVILKAAEGEYAFIHLTEKAADVSDNLLEGTTVDTYVAGPAYVLANETKGVGLYKATLNKDEAGADGTTHFKNNANKAYLPASAVASNAPMFSFSRGGDEEDTTGIEYSSPLNSMPSTAIYDLTGRRVEKMEKGIYIVNGKKVIR